MISNLRRGFVRLRTCAAIVLAAVLAVGCGGSGETSSVAPPSGSAPSVERDISPALIDPRVERNLQAHVAINPSPDVAAAHRLFVFLPGTEGTPDLYRLILRSAAQHGLHAIGINYPNDEAVGTLCAPSANPDCFWDVRREIVTGVDATALVGISVPDSIVTRLTMAIGYLQRNYPDEAWGQFLSGTEIDWSKVVISGHSQGGGHAGVMTKLYTMSRACYFASPADWSVFLDEPAAWTGRPNQTAAARQYGFTHLRDPLVPYSQLSPIWDSLGLDAFGAARSADAGVASLGPVHMVTTNATPADNGPSASPFHGATVLDNVTPLDAAGKPVFDPVWNYLCFE